MSALTEESIGLNGVRGSVARLGSALLGLARHGATRRGAAWRWSQTREMRTEREVSALRDESR